MSNVAERTFGVIWDECGCAITGLEIAGNYILSERSTSTFVTKSLERGYRQAVEYFYSRHVRSSKDILYCYAVRFVKGVQT